MAQINTTLNLGQPSQKGVLYLGQAPTSGISLGSPSNSGSINLGTNASTSPKITSPANTGAPAAPIYDYSQYSIDKGQNIYKNGVKQEYNSMLPLFQNGFNASFITNPYAAPTPDSATTQNPATSGPGTYMQRLGQANLPTGENKGIIPLGTLNTDLGKSTPVTTDIGPITPYTPQNIDFKKNATDLANVSTSSNPAATTATANLLNTAAVPSADYKTAYDTLMAKSAAPSTDYLTAKNNADKYNQQLADTRTAAANSLAANNATDQSIEFKQGRGNIQQTQYLALENALAQAYGAATNQQGQANTQQGMQISGTGAAGGIANTQTGLGINAAQSAGNLAQNQQGLVQSGLGTVANLSTPQLGQPGSQYYQPLQSGNGTAAGGVGITPELMQRYAQEAVNGQYSNIPSSITSNPVLNDQLNQTAKAIDKNYDPSSAGAMSEIYAKVPALKTAATSLYSVFDSVVSSFNSMPDTVKGDQRWLNGKMSDLATFTGAGADKVQAFASAVNEARIQLSQTINSAVNAGVDMGGQTATSLLPDNMSPSQVATQLDLARTFVNARISSYASMGKNYNSNINSGNSTGNSYGSSSGNTYNLPY